MRKDKTTFPLDVMPARLQSLIKKISMAYSINIEPVTVAMITLLSAAIGNTVRILPKEGWLEPIFLWSIIIGPSGSGKTPFVNRLLEVTYSMQADEYNVYKTALEEYEEKAMRVKNRFAELRKPQLIRYIVSDITIEALAGAMETQSKGVLSYQDELAGWLMSHDQYRSKGGDRQKYLELWNCNPWMRDRVSGSQFIKHTGCAILGGIQPLVLPGVFKEDSIIDGLLPRFLFTCLHEKPYCKRSVTNNDMREWHRLFCQCYKIPIIRTAKGDIRHRIIPFSRGAHDIFERFNNEYRAKKRDVLQVFIPKLISYAVRVSGILHILRCDEKKNISVSVLRNSIRLIDYFLEQVKTTLSLYGPSRHTGYTEIDHRLINALKALEKKVDHGKLALSVIKSEVNEGLAEHLKQTNQQIAYSLRSMGLITKEIGGYSHLVWEPMNLHRLFLVC